MKDFQHFQSMVNNAITALEFNAAPKELYDPIRYILSLGGKRMRPALVLLANQLMDGDANKALPAALAVEVFHNFTLLHDDIMDEAPLRRNRPTVHEKWNNNIAILSGDTMMVQAYQLLTQCPPEHLPALMQIFNATAIEVCEGQQYDMNFETMSNVLLDDYLEMIRLKTAVLLGCSLKMGAVLANASPEDADHLYHFGENIGLAFQLQDDILDVYADQQKFGKQVGGDIIANKKTYLMLKALENAKDGISEQLQVLLSDTAIAPEKKVKDVVSIYNLLYVREAAEQAMQEYFLKGLAHLEAVTMPEAKKAPLKQLAEHLMVRDF